MFPGISYFKEMARMKLEGRWREAVGYAFILLAVFLAAYAVLSGYLRAQNMAGAIAGISVAFILRLLILLFVYGMLLHFLKMIRRSDVYTDEEGIVRDKWGRPAGNAVTGETNDDEAENSLGDLIAAFKMQPDRFLVYGIITGLFTLLAIMPAAACVITGQYAGRAAAAAWITSAVLTAACIYFRLSWAMTPFILLDSEGQLTVEKAMKRSRRMMRGRKRKLFLFFLSFIGWALLMPLTLGLGLLWVIPYAFASYCAFYENAAKQG